jgi:menaquinone-9 beta-reductase
MLAASDRDSVALEATTKPHRRRTSMTGKTYDVAVVGASIAGCTAATLLAREGASVALIERHSDPNAYKALCTHFIQPSAVPTMERLGLLPLIEAAGAVPNEIDVWTRWGWVRTPEGARHGYNIRRETLDPMLRRLASETPGVDLMPGQSAFRLLREDGDESGRVSGVAIRDRAGEIQEISARLVVAADGRDSKMARLASVPSKTRPNNRFIYFAHYRNLHTVSGKRSQMWLLEPDTAYTFPNDDGVTLLTCLPARQKLPAFKKDLEGSFERFFEGLPEGPRLAGAERVSKVMGATNLVNRSRPAATNGLAFVGDAALWSDPLWGIGCGWAFQSAEWLAEETAPALAGGGDLARALARYREKHRKKLSGHQRIISDFSAAGSYIPIEKLMFSAAARDERSARHFHAFGSRLVGVREFLAPRAVAHALFVNVRHAAGRRNGRRTERSEKALAGRAG